MEKKLLYEVSIIRPLIIFLLVVLHSFTIYGGGWELPEGISGVPVYYWMCKLISGFRVETIALVAGYVFAFQSIDLGRKYEFKSFVWKKVKRLLLPMLFFGLIYYFLLKFDKSSFAWGGFVMSILSGPGHLWFLPMLFWCFISIWIIDRFRISSIWLLMLLAAISIVPIPVTLPFGLQRLTYFLFYCYAGYYLYANKARIVAKCQNIPFIVVLCVLYLGLLLVNFIVVVPSGWETYAEGTMRYVRIIASSCLKLLYSCCGIMALYLIVLRFSSVPGYKPSNLVLKSNSMCYGVYVYHQFILVFMYYHTQLPVLVGSIALPFVGFAITFVLSVLLTWLTLKTKFGRTLIG